MSETIVPEVMLDKLQAELITYAAKSVAGSPVLELKVHVPINHRIDWDALSKLLRRPSRFSLLSDQAPLPMKSPNSNGGDSPVAAGQLTIDDINADAQPDGPEPTKYSLLLLELPAEEKQFKAAKKWLRKFTGLKAADLDVELEALAAGAGYLVIEGGNEPYVIESKLEMERLGMTVSMHAWGEGSIGAGGSDGTPAPGPTAKVTIDQLTVGSQWLLKGIGTQVRIHNIQGEKVYFHSLYALYSALPAWVFAAAVTPAEPLADLEAVDLAKWEDAPIKPVQLDPETEARMQEPWLMPVVELPLGAAVVYQGRARVIKAALIESGQPVAILRHMDSTVDESEAIAVSEMVEPISMPELSPLVFHALGEATQPEAPVEAEALAVLDPTPSTDTEPGTSEDGGEDDTLIGRYFVGPKGTFKVIDVQAMLVLTQDEGAAEAEADSLRDLLNGIENGMVTPASEYRQRCWDENTTQDSGFAGKVPARPVALEGGEQEAA